MESISPDTGGGNSINAPKYFGMGRLIISAKTLIESSQS
jgi:hypothetical protein